MTFRFITILALSNIIRIRCADLLEVYRQVCPYNAICTMGPLYQHTAENGTLSCCEECFCDGFCWVRNDCCPDVHFKRPAEIDELKCRPAAHFFADDKYEEYLTIYRNVIFTHYLIRDSCPDASDPDLIEKCNGGMNVELEDFIVVSNQARPFEIFMNKHCARCHGVNDVIPWKLQADKCEAKYLTRATETLENMKNYLREHCILHSVPPTDPHLGRLPVCRSDAMSTCDGLKPEFEDIDGLSERCASGGHLLSIEHFYKDSGSLIYRRYKNPFCLAACSANFNVSDSLVLCKKELFKFPIRRSFKDFTILMSMDPIPSRSHENHLCNESFVYDEYRRVCRKLHCPNFQHAFYGDCVSITNSVPDIAMAIHFVLIPDQPTIIEGDIKPISKTTAERVTRKIITSLKLEDCRLYSTLLRAFKYRHTQELLSVNVRIQMHPSADGECTRRTMAGNLSSNFGNFRQFEILINGRVINMKGRFDVFDPPGPNIFHVPFLYDYTGLYQSGGRPFKTDIPKLPCPFVTLDTEEFCSFVEEFFGRECNRSVSLNMPENLFDDLFALKENSVGICLKSYRQYTSTATLQRPSFDMLAVTLWFLLAKLCIQ